MSRSRILAAGLAAYCLGSLTLNLVLHAGGSIPEEHVGWYPIVGLYVFAVPVAVVLLWQLPRHPVTVILAVYVAGQVTSLGLGSLLLAVLHDGTFADGGARFSNALWVLSLPLLSLLIVVFPDGVPEGRWRRLFTAQVAAIAALAITALVDSDPLAPRRGTPR